MPFENVRKFNGIANYVHFSEYKLKPLPPSALIALPSINHKRLQTAPYNVLYFFLLHLIKPQLTSDQSY